MVDGGRLHSLTLPALTPSVISLQYLTSLRTLLLNDNNELTEEVRSAVAAVYLCRCCPLLPGSTAVRGGCRCCPLVLCSAVPANPHAMANPCAVRATRAECAEPLAPTSARWRYAHGGL